MGAAATGGRLHFLRPSPDSGRVGLAGERLHHGVAPIGSVESEKAKRLLENVRLLEAKEQGVPVSLPEVVVIQSHIS